MSVFNKDTINRFSQIVNSDISVDICNYVGKISQLAFENLKLKRLIVGNTIEFAIINEFCTVTQIPNSSLDLAIIFSAPQIEINTEAKIKNKLGGFWQSVKIAFISGLKKKKNKKFKTQKIDEKKYTLADLKNDFMAELVKVLPNTSTITNYYDCLQIRDEKQFSTAVNLFICLAGEQSIKMYKYKQNTFKIINFKNRAKNIEEKQGKTNNNFLTMVRVFNNVIYNINNNNINNLLAESILFNVPNELFIGLTVYDCFIKIVNYLQFKNALNFSSILDENTKIYKDEIINVSALDINKILSSITKYCL